MNIKPLHASTAVHVDISCPREEEIQAVFPTSRDPNNTSITEMCGNKLFLIKYVKKTVSEAFVQSWVKLPEKFNLLKIHKKKVC
jgi:hypothetical protein